MLITKCPRTRRLPLQLVKILDTTLQQGYHSTSCLRRAKPIQNEVRPLYVDTIPPTAEQLHASELFFQKHVPTKSWTATEWRQQPHSESTYLIPEVAFLGRSNSGKSSLMNGLLLDDELCRVGAKPGKTITMHAWSLSLIDPKTKGARKGHQGDTEPKLTVLDMPGYGHGSHGDWGKDIMKYLTARRQLRRAFLLVNPVHGLKDQDLQMLELLRGHGIPHQLIACKADSMKSHEASALLNKMQTHIERHFSKRRQIPLLMTIKDILTVGGLDKHKDRSKFLESAQGLHDIRWAILRATGLDEYAMAFAANGGKPTRSELSQLDGSTPGVSSVSASLQTQAEAQTTHVAEVATAPQDPFPFTSTQAQFTPQTTPSTDANEHELSTKASPRRSQTMVYDPEPTTKTTTADLSIDEFMAEIMESRAQDNTAPQSRQHPDMPGRDQQGGRIGGLRRHRVSDLRPPPRVKDVKRYTGGRRR